MGIGTGIQGFIIQQGSGGGSDNYSVNISVAVDAATLQSNSLIGATAIIVIQSRENGIMNENIVFDSATGTITMPVLATDTYTVTYKKPA